MPAVALSSFSRLTCALPHPASRSAARTSSAARLATVVKAVEDVAVPVMASTTEPALAAKLLDVVFIATEVAPWYVWPAVSARSSRFVRGMLQIDAFQRNPMLSRPKSSLV